MTSTKPDQPPHSNHHNHHYNPLPSTPPPPQYYVVSQQPPSTTTTTHRHRYISTAITLLLILLTLYLLYPSDPHLTITSLSLDHITPHAAPVSLDIELALTIKIRNPDVYSLTYQSLNVSVEYRGEQLGFVTSDDGSVKAFGTSFVDATFVVNGAEVVSETVHLIKDLVKGEIPFTTVSEIRGSLGVLLFSVPIAAKLSCEVVMNTHNQTIEQQDCYPA